MATKRSVISGNRNSIGRDARKAFQIEGLNEIQDKLSDIIDGVTGKKAKAVYYAGGKILRDQVSRNAPYDPKRETGIHLRDGAFVDWGDENKPNVLVGMNYKKTPHAHFAEYGTVKQAAQPYFRPAISQTGGQISETIKSGLLKIILDATGESFTPSAPTPKSTGDPRQRDSKGRFI